VCMADSSAGHHSALLMQFVQELFFQLGIIRINNSSRNSSNDRTIYIASELTAH